MTHGKINMSNGEDLRKGIELADRSVGTLVRPGGKE